MRDAPVLVLQHLSGDGPAYLERWLLAQGQRYEVYDAQAGQAYPHSIQGYRALAILGGEMSANDDLASLRDAQALIRQAIAADRPVIGHCLGGQLMARALGARVYRATAPEIGWHEVTIHPSPEAAAWFGPAATRTVFQWHRECFELPPGARSLARSPRCAHQAFSLGPHLALQFHLELDDEKLQRWSVSGEAIDLALQRRDPEVASGARMRAQALQALPVQQRLADAVYRRWLGL